MADGNDPMRKMMFPPWKPSFPPPSPPPPPVTEAVCTHCNGSGKEPK